MIQGVFLSLLVLSSLNTYRLRHGLGSVHPTEMTCEFAQVRVDETTRNWSHDGFIERNAAGNMPYVGLASENLARGYNENEVIEAWDKSPTHKKILLADTDEVCIMMKLGSDGRMYYALEGHKSDILDEIIDYVKRRWSR